MSQQTVQDALSLSNSNDKPLPEMPNRLPSILKEEKHQEASAQLQRRLSARAHIIRHVGRVRAGIEQRQTDSVTITGEEEATESEANPTRKVWDSARRGIVQRFNPAHTSNVIAGIERTLGQEMEEAKLELTYADLCYLVEYLSATAQKTFVVMATKGGAGKTPLITYLAALYTWIVGKSGLLLEANENDGTARLRLDMRRDGLTLLPDAVGDHQLIKDHQTACDNFGKFSQTNLHALLSDSDESRNKFSMDEFLSMFNVLRPQFDSAFGDTGNGINVTNEGMFLVADVVLFPAVADDLSTFHTLLTTMANLYKLGHHEKLQKYSAIVINGTREGDTIEEFLEKFYAVAEEMTAYRKNRKTGKDENGLWTDDPVQLLKDFGFAYDENKRKFTGEGIYMVSYSQWIKDGNPVSILPEDTGLETLTHFADILAHCLVMEAPTKEEKQRQIKRRLEERNEVFVSNDAKKQIENELFNKLRIGMRHGDGDTVEQVLSKLMEITINNESRSDISSAEDKSTDANA